MPRHPDVGETDARYADGRSLATVVTEVVAENEKQALAAAPAQTPVLSADEQERIAREAAVPAADPEPERELTPDELAFVAEHERELAAAEVTLEGAIRRSADAAREQVR